jgi:hypothetical protein
MRLYGSAGMSFENQNMGTGIETREHDLGLGLRFMISSFRESPFNYSVVQESL